MSHTTCSTNRGESLSRLHSASQFSDPNKGVSCSLDVEGLSARRLIIIYVIKTSCLAVAPIDICDYLHDEVLYTMIAERIGRLDVKKCNVVPI